LARQVAGITTDSAAEIKIWRDEAEMSLVVVIGQQPAKLAAIESKAGEEFFHSEALNADLAMLNSERRARFEVAEDVDGVLVLDVKAGSILEQGLRPGDVIKKVAQSPVASPREVEALVQKAQSGGSQNVLMLVSRKGEDLFLGLKLGVA